MHIEVLAVIRAVVSDTSSDLVLQDRDTQVEENAEPYLSRKRARFADEEWTRHRRI
jgi:hypothetical protein